MKWKKLAAMGCIVTMTAVLTIGCGTTGSTGSTSADSTEVTKEQESEAVTMQVTSVDGDTVTGDVGEMSAAPSGDQAPGGDNAQQPGGQAPGGEAPDGQKPDGQPSEGGAPDQDGGAPQGSPFAASGETQTFTLTDTTEITVESAGNTAEGTADDITVGSILEVTLDTDGNALTVLVKNMNGGAPQGQGGFGGSSDLTNVTANGYHLYVNGEQAL